MIATTCLGRGDGPIDDSISAGQSIGAMRRPAPPIPGESDSGPRFMGSPSSTCPTGSERLRWSGPPPAQLSRWRTVIVGRRAGAVAGVVEAMAPGRLLRSVEAAAAKLRRPAGGFVAPLI